MTHAQRNEAIIRKIEAYTERNTRSQQTAMRALVKEGFFSESGEVTPRFAPEIQEEKASA